MSEIVPRRARKNRILDEIAVFLLGLSLRFRLWWSPQASLTQAHVHCWHGTADGIAPVILPLDGSGPCAQGISVTRTEGLRVVQECCRCPDRRVRTWGYAPDPRHPRVASVIREL